MLPPSIENQPGSALRLHEILHTWRGRFTEATADFTRAIELQPDDEEVWTCLATVLAKSGQLDAYRELCRKSVARFGETTDPVIAERIAGACLILHSSGADLATIARMADTAVTAAPDHAAMTWFQFAKGWAEYRQGRFASAVEWMQKVLARTGRELDRDAQAYAVLAMAQHRLKQVNDARAALAKGVASGSGDSGELGGGGFSWIVAQLLLREAKALIEGGPAASKD